MPRERKTKRSSSLPGLASFAVLLVIVCGIIWLSRSGTGLPFSEDLAAVGPEASATDRRLPAPTSTAGLQNGDNAATALARICAALAEVSLSAEQMTDFRTVEDVARALPHPTVPLPHRILTMQRGNYPDLHAEMREIMGQPLTDEVKPYAELTRAEKLLLYSDWTGTGILDDPAHQQISARMNIADLTFVSEYSALSGLWHEQDRQQLLAIYEASHDDGAALRRLLAEDWLPRFASPVTARFFEPWHQEWSAGQGYLCEVNDASERARLVEAIVARQVQALPPPTPSQILLGDEPAKSADVPADAFDFAKFFYFRLYGEEPGVIIAEGILQLEDYQAYQRRRNAPPVRPVAP
ncbi:MAG: hypothetical protein A2Y63_02555 [Candidatus Riflebacteria bacterium RBG_13_59_9]|nr:MAG: hypothetical protein A2Y63_02555 [Candidatus Riflebacteria bacterium RBG_13_59_9]